MPGLTPDEIVDALGMTAHPEGGAYAETWRDAAGGSEDSPGSGGRGTGSAITFLLRGGEVSAWHRVDATEIWHFHGGSPVELRVATSASQAGIATHVVGMDLAGGERPQVVVPAGAWQSARSLGEWSLVGCTVSPAFTFEGFELAGAATVEALERAGYGDQDGDQDGEAAAPSDGDAAAPASSIL